MRLIPFVIISWRSHLAVPLGTITVSPELAAVIAALTSVKEGLVAVIVPGCLTVIV
jgi:hypothetical protein